MKKIILFWPFYPPDPGAAAARGAAFSKYLQTSSEVHVATRDNKKYQSYPQTVNVYRFSRQRHIVEHLMHIFQTIRLVFKIKPTMIIASYPDAIWSTIGYIAALISRTPYILDLRDLPKTSYTLKSKIFFTLLKVQTRFAYLVLVTTSMQSEFTQKVFTLNEEKILLVPNGYDLENAVDDSNTERSIDIVHLGSINPERDTDRIFKALCQFEAQKKKITVDFIGVDYQNSYAKSFIDKLLSQHFKYVTITHTKELSHQDAFKRLTHAKIGLVTLSEDKQLAYQLPVKIYEYMAAGLVVAALLPDNVTMIEQFITHNKVGFFSRNTGTFVEKTRTTLANRQLISSYRTRNQHVIKKFNRKESVQILANKLEHYDTKHY